MRIGRSLPVAPASAKQMGGDAAGGSQNDSWEQSASVALTRWQKISLRKYIPASGNRCRSIKVGGRGPRRAVCRQRIELPFRSPSGLRRQQCNRTVSLRATDGVTGRWIGQSDGRELLAARASGVRVAGVVLRSLSEGLTGDFPGGKCDSSEFVPHGWHATIQTVRIRRP